MSNSEIYEKVVVLEKELYQLEDMKSIREKFNEIKELLLSGSLRDNIKSIHNSMIELMYDAITNVWKEEDISQNQMDLLNKTTQILKTNLLVDNRFEAHS